jgi:hypothetical protein
MSNGGGWRADKLSDEEATVFPDAIQQQAEMNKMKMNRDQYYQFLKDRQNKYAKKMGLVVEPDVDPDVDDEEYAF